jgi:hypothetical protein
MNLQMLRHKLQFNESGCWKEIQAMRAIVERNDMELMRKAIGTTPLENPTAQFVRDEFSLMLRLLERHHYDFNSFDPGHGRGHVMRDYVNAFMLADQFDDSTLELMIGMMAGACHDLACGLIYRYDEQNRAVRHAEAGALLFLEMSAERAFYFHERMAIAYAIAAHTHYLRESEVTCADGVTRTIRPYIDTYADGQPIIPIWLPRWIDRLDLCGPSIVGRHFLTLGRDHHDYSNALGFTPAKFDMQMRPLLRPMEEIKLDPNGSTLLEHVRMLVTSQTNDSPYGKFDNPRMVELRDFNTSLMRGLFTSWGRLDIHTQPPEITLRQWEIFLGDCIEPSEMGRQNAKELCARVLQLDPETRDAALRLFYFTMHYYNQWSDTTKEETRKTKSFQNQLPGISDDIRRTLTHGRAAALSRTRKVRNTKI